RTATASETVESSPPERIATPFMARDYRRARSLKLEAGSRQSQRRNRASRFRRGSIPLAAWRAAGDDGRMRCFLAIEAPDGVRKMLVRVQEALRRADADVKWVEEKNLHLSLKFLGEVSEEQV